MKLYLLYILAVMSHFPDSINRFFFNDTATSEIYTLSLHDALPIYLVPQPVPQPGRRVVDRAPLWAVQSRRLRRAAGAELRVDQPRCGRQYPGQLRVGRGRAGTSVVGGLAGRTHLRRRAREPTRLLRPGKRHAILARQPHDRRDRKSVV